MRWTLAPVPRLVAPRCRRRRRWRARYGGAVLGFGSDLREMLLELCEAVAPQATAWAAAGVESVGEIRTMELMRALEVERSCGRR